MYLYRHVGEVFGLKVFVGTSSSRLGAMSTTTGFKCIDDVINTVAVTMLATFSLILPVT